MQTTQATSNWELYKRLLGYLKSYWKMFIVSVVAMLIVAGTMPAFGYLLKPLINEGFVDKNMKSMSWLPLAIVALFFVRGLFNFINEYCTTYLSSHLVQRLRSEMFNKMMHLPTSYFSSNTGGRLMSRILNDVNQITDAGFNVITVIAKDGVSVVGLLGLLTYLNWRLTLITFIILPVVAVCIQTVSKRLRKLSANNQIYLGQLMQVLGESINGERVVKIYGGQDYENRRFERIANDVRRNLLKQVSASSAGTGITQLMASVALAAIIYAAARQAGLSGFSAGDFMSFLSSMIMMFDPIKRMTGVMQSLQRGLAAAESVFTFLDQPEESNEGKQILSPNPGDIEFCDVVHRYPEAERNSLNHINLLVPQGKVTALVGASGCGKTTLANMLPRFLNPDEGKVLISGVNINEYTLESLRSRMAFVSQNVVLFNGTIAENIAYAQADKFSEEEIINAAKAANAWEFIQKMPQGLHTEVGENGLKLSGGQRQRLAIARALLKNAPILILDEATSALDNESERLVQTALENLMQNRTTLVIAHRLSTIEKADNIVVMHEGNVVEQGTHHELISAGGRYSDLHSLSEKSAKPASK
ncbi:lipid A export permease/ATP-binding protein MsbA [Neisseria subflava]|uniref:lipid A export permease/ATP-binding protein MsbA n=1 Tax=Neisseria subflava TaxID=28449 RepID=UPI002029FE1A|nr:lipid A export permease/ATP-binding protein MsbA [Neisseria subflava]MCL9778829.1 lipid A export permease/ATP-binding protein MsbA [Neisseria subflava]UTG76675.1 lipid A export permease/ATP-binding protein MsbA [Neisseria subflava]